jgi:hypothetical protein
MSATASLPELLKRENELLTGTHTFHRTESDADRTLRLTSTEIRELDGERQSLVYNHHHELIDASDTIKKVPLLSSFKSHQRPH